MTQDIDFYVGDTPVEMVCLGDDSLWVRPVLASLDLLGDGVLSASAWCRLLASVVLSGGGALSVSINQKFSVFVDFSGDGDLDASTIPQILRQGVFFSSGTLSATAIRSAARDAALSGGGTLSATVEIKNIQDVVSAPFTASRTVSVTFAAYTPQENDLIVLWPSSMATTSPAVVPAGWISVRGGNTGVNTTNVTHFCVYHFVTAAEAAAVTTTFTLTNFWNAVQTGAVVGLAARYVSAQVPVDNYSNTTVGSPVTNHQLGAFAAAGVRFSNSLVVGSVGAAGPTTYGAPSVGWTKLLESNDNVGRYLARRNLLTTAGVAPNINVCTAGTATNYIGYNLLLVQNFTGTYSTGPFTGSGTLSASVYPAPMVLATASAPLTASRSPSLTFPGYVAKTDDIVAIWPSAMAINVTIALPANWVNIRGGAIDAESNANEIAGVFHVVTAAEQTAGTTIYTATNLYAVAQTGDVIGMVIRYVSTSFPIDAAISGIGTNLVTNHALAALSGIRFDNSLVIGCAASSALGAYSAPTAGWTQLAQSNNNSARYLMRRDALTAQGVTVSAGAMQVSPAAQYCSIHCAFSPLGVVRPSGTGTLSATAVMYSIQVSADFSGGGTLSATADAVFTPLLIPGLAYWIDPAQDLGASGTSEGPPEHILPGTAPTSVAGGNYTLGLRFTANAPGKITHIRGWVGGGTHYFSLWDTVVGTKIAGATATFPVGVGAFREVALPTPVDVVVDKSYTASVSTDDAEYGSYFAGPITSLTTSLGSADGFYAGGSDVFPGSTAGGYNYNTDVTFQRAPLAPLVDGQQITTYISHDPAGRAFIAPAGYGPIFRSSSVGGKPRIQFVGASSHQLYSNDYNPGLAGLTFVFVAQIDVPTSYGMMLVWSNDHNYEIRNDNFSVQIVGDYQSGGPAATGAFSRSPNTDYVILLRVDTSEVKIRLYINDTEQLALNSVAAMPNLSRRIYVGHRADGYYWQGLLAEAMVISGPISASDRAKLMTYLRAKHSAFPAVGL